MIKGPNISKTYEQNQHDQCWAEPENWRCNLNAANTAETVIGREQRSSRNAWFDDFDLSEIAKNFQETERLTKKLHAKMCRCKRRRTNVRWLKGSNSLTTTFSSKSIKQLAESWPWKQIFSKRTRERLVRCVHRFIVSIQGSWAHHIDALVSGCRGVSRGWP